MNKNCINSKIESAMKDKNIIKIMHKASSSFYAKLDQDEIYTCQINALWRSFNNFDPSKNTKFTTYLYKGVLIECIKAWKFVKKNSKFNNGSMHENIPCHQSDHVLFEILDSLESMEDKELIIDKYNNLTIQEMSDKRSYSRETVRKKLKKIYEKIKE